MNLGKIIIKNEKDILSVRHAVKHICRVMDFDNMDGIRVATAASELSRNVYEHASSGEVFIDLTEKKKRPGLKLTFKDKGRGIGNIEEILNGKYISSKGMGIGLLGAKNLMNDFEIETAVGKGTTVSVVKWLPRGKDVTDVEVKQIRQMLAKISEESTLEILNVQNRELVELLDELRDKNLQIEDVNRELEVTNAGILSLYQEIDKKNEELLIKDRNKSEFIRTAGHEIRTPINSIITLSDILTRKIDGDLSSEQEKQVRMIMSSARQLLNLINSLLDLSRIEKGIIEINVSGFKIVDLLQNAVERIMPLAEEKGLKLDYKSKAGISEIRSDFNLLTQILQNILGNAVKFTDKGGIMISAEDIKISDREFINIDISDTGIGIPEDKTEEIFGEFKQLRQNRNQEKGTGLGLAITRKIIKLLGGDITVKSKPGEGSVFSLTFPADLQEAAELQEVPGTPDVKEYSQGKKILVVEDDEKTIYAMKKNLEVGGFKVIVARTFGKALELAKEHDISAVCLDLLLHGDEDEGWDILKAFKRNPETSHIPIIIVTILRDRKEKAKALEADDYITKPVVYEDLIARLRTTHRLDENKTVLVVDDEEAQIMAFKVHLKGFFRVLTASDGREALRVMSRDVPDIIITDLVMPVMDGYEFIENLKGNEAYRNIPVIAYTSKDMSIEEEEVLSRNTSEVYRKDETSIEELSHILRKILKNM